MLWIVRYSILLNSTFEFGYFYYFLTIPELWISWYEIVVLFSKTCTDVRLLELSTYKRIRWRENLSKVKLLDYRSCFKPVRRHEKSDSGNESIWAYFINRTFNDAGDEFKHQDCILKKPRNVI